MRRRMTHVGALAILLACALAGTLLTAGPASARSVGYYVYNLSSHPMELQTVKDGLDGPAVFEDGPDAPLPPQVGDVLMPGGAPQHIELDFNGSKHRSAHLSFRRPNQNPVGVWISTWNGAICQNVGGTPGSCPIDGSRITLLDPPGTVHEVSKGNAQEQAEILNELCNKVNSAKCTFKPTNRTKTLSQSHVVSGTMPLANCTPDDTDQHIKSGDVVGTSNSIGLEFGTDIENNWIIGKVTLSIKAKYEHEWTYKRTFDYEVSWTAKPGWLTWIAGTNPVVRDTGDFTLTLGGDPPRTPPNTTWNLRGVSFETPDPGRDGDGTFVPDARELSPDEYASICKHKKPGEPGLTQVPLYLVPMQWRGTRTADRLLGGPESHTIRGFAGNDLLHGGPGHDTLDGGRDDDSLYGGRDRDTLDGGSGNDILDGGAGRDTLDGGSGADTMTDNRGPTLVRIGADTGPGRDTVDVRDGAGDDTVMCGSRLSTVVVDADDRVIGRCGRVSRSGSTR
jgi:hypothetical protein